ncbi:MAG: phosphate ABC transporter substrate-binding protein [Enterocloster bolteae]
MKVRRNLLIALSLLSLSANAQRIKGSDTVLPVAQQTAERFMNQHPDARVTVTGGGTGVGISALMDNTTDIAMASRPIKFSEKMKTKEAGQEVDEVIVAYDALAVVVHPSNPVKQLTRQQLEDIFRGKITNWKDAGGNDAPIVVVGRESGSGTRSAFEELLELEDVCKYSNELDSTGAVMAKVASTPGAIGYVSLDVLDDTVKAVKLEGAEPTEENIKAGSYFLSRPFVMATKGEISEQNDLVKALFDYIYSEEGAEIVKSVGLIAVDK